MQNMEVEAIISVPRLAIGWDMAPMGLTPLKMILYSPTYMPKVSERTSLHAFNFVVVYNQVNLFGSPSSLVVVNSFSCLIVSRIANCCLRNSNCADIDGRLQRS